MRSRDAPWRVSTCLLRRVPAFSFLAARLPVFIAARLYPFSESVSSSISTKKSALALLNTSGGLSLRML